MDVFMHKGYPWLMAASVIFAVVAFVFLIRRMKK